MMISSGESLRTWRLRLLPGSLEMARAAVAGAAAMRDLLGLNLAEGWPGRAEA